MGRHSVNIPDEAFSEKSVKKTLRHSHSGFAGRTIIQRIEQQMDKRRKVLEDLVVENGILSNTECAVENGKLREHEAFLTNQGRYEGLAAALALLRSSSVPHEISRSNERLGIE